MTDMAQTFAFSDDEMAELNKENHKFEEQKDKTSMYLENFIFSGDNFVLAQKFSDKACNEDPTISTCWMNLYYSNDGMANQWWILMKDIVEYDIVEVEAKENEAQRVGILVLKEGTAKSVGNLYYVANTQNPSQSVKLVSGVQEFHTVNGHHLYVLLKNIPTKSGAVVNYQMKERLIKFDLLQLDKGSTLIRFNSLGGFSENLKLHFLTSVIDQYTTFLVIKNQITSFQDNELDTANDNSVLYTSDVIGNKFAISLEKIHILDAGLVNSRVDLNKPVSMEFVVLANQQAESNKQSQLSRKHQDMDQFSFQASNLQIQTVISKDNGGSWSPIYLTSTESCRSEPGSCQLNLHLLQSSSIDQYMPSMKSYSSQAGFMIANGNIGTHLIYQSSQDYAKSINTYATIDGGQSWYQVAKGLHSYLYLEEVGILVLTGVDREIKRIYYSLDFGTQNLKSLTISERVVTILKVVQDKQNPFGIIIYVQTGEDAFEFINVDFKSIMESEFKPCQGISTSLKEESDYEQFMPFEVNEDGFNCYMGAYLTYLRKKPSVPCYFDPETTKMSQHSLTTSRQKMSCSCALSDYECDEGFESTNPVSSQTATLMCVPIDHMKKQIIKAEADCTFGDFFYLPSGYRKKPGNMCLGGQDMSRRKKHYCSEGMKDWNLRFLIYASLALSIGYVVSSFIWIFDDEVRKCKGFFKSKWESFRSRRANYKNKKREMEEESNNLLKNQNC